MTEFEKRHLSEAARLRVRAMLDKDPWYFSSTICKHGEKAVERFHRPLLYLMAGAWDRLIEIIDHPDFQSIITQEIRREWTRMRYDWRTASGRAKIRKLKKVNCRVSRRRGKSTMANDADLWTASVDPNESIGIGSKSDPAVWDQFTGPMAQIVENDTDYRLFYPDRIPQRDFQEMIKTTSMRLAGRSPGKADATIWGRGITSQWTSRHFTRIRADDITGVEAKGEASMDDARRWMANIGGISVDEIFGGTFLCFVGTIMGPDDDHSILKADPYCLSIEAPVWIKGCDMTMENILVDGEPTLPEWGSKEMIKADRAATLADPELGYKWWLQNFELSAHMDGSDVFPTTAFRDSIYWLETEKHEDRSIPSRLWLTRFDRDEDTKKPLRDEHGRMKVIRTSLDDLWTYLGVDQAMANKAKADEWCVGVSGFASPTAGFALDCAFGRGYESMAPAMLEMHNKWNMTTNGVRRIGIESNGFQSLTFEILKLSPQYRILQSKLQKIPSGISSKEDRLRNTFAARLRAGTYFIPGDPGEEYREECLFEVWNGVPAPMHEMIIEAKKYRPGPKVSDSKIEGMAISIQTGSAPPSEEQTQQIVALIQMQKRDFEDSFEGIPTWNFVEEIEGVL